MVCFFAPHSAISIQNEPKISCNGIHLKNSHTYLAENDGQHMSHAYKRALNSVLALFWLCHVLPLPVSVCYVPFSSNTRASQQYTHQTLIHTSISHGHRRVTTSTYPNKELFIGDLDHHDDIYIHTYMYYYNTGVYVLVCTFDFAQCYFACVWPFRRSGHSFECNVKRSYDFYEVTVFSFLFFRSTIFSFCTNESQIVIEIKKKHLKKFHCFASMLQFLPENSCLSNEKTKIIKCHWGTFKRDNQFESSFLVITSFFFLFNCYCCCCFFLFFT